MIREECSLLKALGVNAELLSILTNDNTNDLATEVAADGSAYHRS